MNKTAKAAQFVVCVNNRDYPAALEVRKLYRRVTDSKATRMGLMRVVDESGGGYLYPAGFFMPVRLSAASVRALRRRR